VKCVFSTSDLLLNFSLLVLLSYTKASQAEKFEKLILFRSSRKPPATLSWTEEDALKTHSSAISQANKIMQLPSQSCKVNFDQYSGYVTIDPMTGRALFYYFAESPYNP